MSGNNPPDNEKTAKFVRATPGSEFVNEFKFKNIDVAADWLVKFCSSSGSSVGVNSSQYVKEQLKDAVYVITAHNYTDNLEKYQNIIGYIILTPDNSEQSKLPQQLKGKSGIHLALICTRFQGTGIGSVLLTKLDELSKKHDYQFISLAAVSGVQGVYEKRGYKYFQLNDENLPEMIKKLGGRKRKTRKNGLRKRKTMRRRR